MMASRPPVVMAFAEVIIKGDGGENRPSPRGPLGQAGDERLYRKRV